jgi:hypothetical protein
MFILCPLVPASVNRASFSRSALHQSAFGLTTWRQQHMMMNSGSVSPYAAATSVAVMAYVASRISEHASDRLLRRRGAEHSTWRSMSGNRAITSCARKRRVATLRGAVCTHRQAHAARSNHCKAPSGTRRAYHNITTRCCSAWQQGALPVQPAVVRSSSPPVNTTPSKAWRREGRRWAIAGRSSTAR